MRGETLRVKAVDRRHGGRPRVEHCAEGLDANRSRRNDPDAGDGNAIHEASGL